MNRMHLTMKEPEDASTTAAWYGGRYDRGGCGEGTPSSPELLLLLSVFQRAVADAFAPRGTMLLTADARQDALDWLFCDARLGELQRQRWPLTVEAVAEHLDVPLAALRERVRRRAAECGGTITMTARHRRSYRHDDSRVLTGGAGRARVGA